MTAELLTRAAALIREQARAVEGYDVDLTLADVLSPARVDQRLTDFCVAWSPAVALAVADQLEAAAGLASWKDQIGMGVVSAVVDAALVVARTYLGEDA